ncbi:TraB/GumN family protein [Maribacter algicola]|uniref:TraB/GumN family protein n=1 Tax=Meishania litoralis TaxID=3434685 RepID=A0ACC7LMY6_9FLAO
MRIFLPLFLLCCSGLFAQSPDPSRNESVNSLLWEISGNGLQESSYLYGTMHVSKRIAFRLDDVFYEALDKSTIIALESDPETWLENSDNLDYMGYGQGNGFVSKGFYTYPFQIRNPRKEEVAAYLAFEDSRINNILYRTDEYAQNFEEETYLDMFIYQAGKKFDKTVIALEDLEESSALVGRASMNAMKQKPDEWLQKKMQQQDPMGLLQDAYRNRNISLLDSIDKAIYTEHYLKHMLFIRNRNMAEKLDSIMPTGKVFTGIGAAHLPGEQGVIAMLRDKGYSVNPLVSRSTPKGKRLKTKFEQAIHNNKYSEVAPDDDFFSIALPSGLYPIAEFVNTTYISPDLANGSYVMVNRVPTFQFLKQDNTYTLESLDKLLFENIPGTILEKNKITKNGFKGLDIKNQLKNGDHQRYQIYITPLEILIFKMGGEGDFVEQHSDTIFNSLTFHRSAKKFTLVKSGFEDFEIRLPSHHSFPNKYRVGDRLLQAYDSITGTYYFLKKATLNDFNFLEEDSFELSQIQKRFYQDLNLEATYENPKLHTQTSRAIIDSTTGKQLYLKTVLKEGDYYLMGTVTKDEEEANAFFDSFKIKVANHGSGFKKVRDTALFFSTISSVKPPKFVENSNNYYNGRAKPKDYGPFNKKTIYQNENNEAIAVEVNKSHDFLMFQNIDSVWALRKKLLADKKFNILHEKDSSYADGHHELELVLGDTASTRGIWVKNVVKGGLLYEVKTTIDTLIAPSRFVREFFSNFSPSDTLIGKSILTDKTPAFFAALRNNDSILVDGHRFVQFGEKHLDSLKYYISEFDFPSDKKNIQSDLIQKLGQIDSPEVLPFFQEFYGKSYNNSYAQAKILQAVSKKADEASVSLLLGLLSKDLPLVSNKFEIYSIFKPFMDSLPLAKKLYPELLDYSAIEEHKSPIFSMLAQLVAENRIKPKIYKRYRKQMLNDAKVQLKRQLGISNYRHLNRNRNNNGNRNAGRELLEDYAVLLYPFIQEKEVKQFFERLQLVQDEKLKTTYVALLAKDNISLPLGLIDSLAADINSRILLFNKFKKIGKLDLMPSRYRTEKALAEALLFEFKAYDERRHSSVFLEQRSLQYKGKALTGYYFKTRDNQDYDKNYKMHLIVFENGKALTTLPYYQNDGLRIEDTDTDAEALAYVTEAFLLKDRPRAQVYRPNSYGAYGFHGY